MGAMPSVGVFLRDPSPYLREFRRKTTENSERLGRQARPRFVPGTSRLPALRVTAEPLVGQIIEGLETPITKHTHKTYLTFILIYFRFVRVYREKRLSALIQYHKIKCATKYSSHRLVENQTSNIPPLLKLCPTIGRAVLSS